MPQQKKNKDWEPDFDRIFSVKGGVLFIGGQPQSAEVVMTLKSEASAMKHIMLVELLANTISNEAMRYALEEIKQEESADVRSSKLAFAQALAMWNKHVWTNIALLSKL